MCSKFAWLSESDVCVFYNAVSLLTFHWWQCIVLNNTSQSWCVFWSSRVQISAARPPIVTDVPRSSLFYKQMLQWRLVLRHDAFLLIQQGENVPVVFYFFFGVTVRRLPAFLDHTQWHTTVGRIPLDEGSALRRGPYLTTRDTEKRHVHATGGILFCFRVRVLVLYFIRTISLSWLSYILLYFCFCCRTHKTQTSMPSEGLLVSIILCSALHPYLVLRRHRPAFCFFCLYL